MLRSRFLVIIGIAAAASGCGKRVVQPPAAPAAAPATPPPAPAPPDREAAPAVDEYQRLEGMSADEIDRLGLFADIHFNFDRSDIREADQALLVANAEVLRKYDFIRVAVEGHCDERGTTEYNLALGDRRAKAAHDYLVSLGVPAFRLKTVSYGKEAPLCRDSSQDCWARNRRAHLTVTGKSGGRGPSR
jgi:peptidoglycan-associated lipoprotein